MAQVLKSTERKTLKCSRVAVMFLMVSIMGMGILSMMRSDSQALDLQISAIQEQIAACEKERNDLEREAVEMMSPAAVHAYAARQLGMTQVHLVGTIRLDVAGRADGMAAAQLVGEKTSFAN
ncbi:MAG: hypothetical protein ACOYD9_08555 [Pyramidobacter sp.]|jgi:cell division protein FtsB